MRGFLSRAAACGFAVSGGGGSLRLALTTTTTSTCTRRSSSGRGVWQESALRGVVRQQQQQTSAWSLGQCKDVHSSSTEDSETPSVTAAGQARQRAQRSARVEDRISVLQEKLVQTSSEQKELKGLLEKYSFQEQYCPQDFSEAHVAFKRVHNQVFCRLLHYCQQQQQSLINIFYLDGPDAQTTEALLEAGFDYAQCHVANRHAASCDELVAVGLPAENVLHASAADALTPTTTTPSFGNVCFGAYYFDGCGGHVPVLLQMIEAGLANRQHLQPPIAIGFSLVGGNRNVVDKEQQVFREICKMGKPRGLRVEHVLDDPERYGIPFDVNKVEGNTLTSWCILETDTR